MQLEEVRKVVISNRSLFSEIGKDLETLKNYLRLLPTLREVSEYDRNLIRAYPELNLSAAAKLSGYCDSIVSLKMPLLGYLFAGKQLLSYGEMIAKITGVLDAKPHKKLEEYEKISRLPTRLTKLIFGFGGTNDDLKSVFEFSKLTGFVSSSQAEVLNKFANTSWSEAISNTLPTDIMGLLGASENQINLMESWASLMESKEKLQVKFDEIPDFDYLQEKTQFEAMNTMKLVNRIDERVTDFAIQQKADARTLQQIIRAKAKFPVEMFSKLSEAFPCMIAGLRDFAEFIPLESDLFELVIIDEASQVSIAQALPAILRAKRFLCLGIEGNLVTLKLLTHPSSSTLVILVKLWIHSIRKLEMILVKKQELKTST